MKKECIALAFTFLLPFGGLSSGAEKPLDGFSLQDLQTFISGAAGELDHVLALEKKQEGLPPETKITRVKYLLEFFLSAGPKGAEWQHETSHAKDALDLVHRALNSIQRDEPQAAWAFLRQARLHVGSLQGVLGVRVLHP